MIIPGLPFGVMGGVKKPIEFVSSITKANNVFTSSHTISAPADNVTGDLLFAFGGTPSNVSLSSFTGWTVIFANIVGSGDRFCYAAYRFTEVSEPTSYSVQLSDNARLSVVIGRYRNAKSIVQTATGTGTSGASLSGVTAGNSLLYAGVHGDNLSTRTSTPPSGYVERVDLSSLNEASATLADRLDAPAGNTGTVRNTWSSGNTSSNQLHVLLEARN
jgi:hypothetical protein